MNKRRWFYFVMYFWNKPSQVRIGYSNLWLEKYNTPLVLMMAHKVVVPSVLEVEAMWRIHRMFIKDKVSHLKLKVYCTREEFKEIYRNISRNKFYKACKAEELIIDKDFGIATDSNECVGSDRDEVWPFEVTESWPYFANGMSMAYYKMIDVLFLKYCEENYIDHAELIKKALREQLLVYRKVDALVESIWIKWSYHFLFHHSSVLFGEYFGQFKLPKKNLIVKKVKGTLFANIKSFKWKIWKYKFGVLQYIGLIKY